MAEVLFDPVRFRDKFPEFPNPPYTDPILQRKWDAGTCIIDPNDSGCFMDTKQLTCVLDLMVAHLLKLQEMLDMGQNVVAVTSATIDKVSVSVEPPKAATQYQLWLSTTPYGQEIRVILQVSSVGGTYIGGLPERRAFRKVGGRF